MNATIDTRLSSSTRWPVDSAKHRLDQFFTRIEKKPPELDFVFTQLFHSESYAQLETLDHCQQSPLNGALVSVKDLFDVKGYRTQSGSNIFSTQPVAGDDAQVISLLKHAGALIVGKTNMTELAYSGLGLNPHFGTPDNPLSQGHIPGGSSSGGAVSVATDAVNIAIGTDTGGSVRIPAAFTGLVGFKPSQNSISRSGCQPLSTSLDSIGPIARSVEHCEWAWHCMSNTTTVISEDTINETNQTEIIVPTNFGLSELDPAVQSAFETLLKTLENQGWKINRRKVEALDYFQTIPAWQFSCVESQSIYSDLFNSQLDQVDPRVASRIARANDVSGIDYCTTLRMRETLKVTVRNELASAYLLLPTVAILAPTFQALKDDEDYNRLNILALRNTSMANVIDGCSISVPFRHDGNTIGAMLTATTGRDQALLNLAKTLEANISQQA